jgi:hypothetical protein
LAVPIAPALAQPETREAGHEQLDGVDAQVWRTDEHGTITISFTGQGPVVASER